MSNDGGTGQRAQINYLSIAPYSADGLWRVRALQAPMDILFTGPRAACIEYAKQNHDYVARPRGASPLWVVCSAVSGPIAGPWVYGRAKTWLQAHKRALKLDWLKLIRVSALPQGVTARGPARDMVAVLSEGNTVNYLWIEQAN